MMSLATDSPRLDAMARELARLEQANRWWRRSTVLALLAMTAIGLMGQVMPPSRVLEVEQLLLRDTTGRIRVSLSTLEDDAIVLTFRDRLERDRLAIGLLPEGAPLVSLYDEHRRRRAAFGVLDTDAPQLSLYGKDGTSRAHLALHDDGPRFVGLSADGTVLWEKPSARALP
jgi:hypothetical protein